MKWIIYLTIFHSVRLGFDFLISVGLNDDNFAYLAEIAPLELTVTLVSAAIPFIVDAWVMKKHGIKKSSLKEHGFKSSVAMGKTFFLSFSPLLLIAVLYDIGIIQTGAEWFNGQVLGPAFVSIMSTMVAVAFVALPVIVGSSSKPSTTSAT